MTSRPDDRVSKKHRAFLHLFGGCSRWLRGYLMSLLCNLNDVDDAFQETGRLCWEKFHLYHRGTEFRAWACRIAYFEAMKIRDRRRRTPYPLSEQFCQVVSEDAVAMADRIDMRNLALRECLGKLDARDRDLIDKRYTFNMTSRELAEGIGRSVRTVQLRLRRVHDLLARCIGRRLAEEGMS